MNPFTGSDVWQHLPARHRRAVAAAAERSPRKVVTYRLPPEVSPERVERFARANLLRGFFDRTGLVVVSVAARRESGAVRLRLGLIRHPPGVPLPAWGTNMNRAISICFPGAVRVESFQEKEPS